MCDTASSFMFVMIQTHYDSVAVSIARHVSRGEDDIERQVQRQPHPKHAAGKQEITPSPRANSPRHAHSATRSPHCTTTFWFFSRAVSRAAIKRRPRTLKPGTAAAIAVRPEASLFGRLIIHRRAARAPRLSSMLYLTCNSSHFEPHIHLIASLFAASGAYSIRLPFHVACNHPRHLDQRQNMTRFLSLH